MTLRRRVKDLEARVTKLEERLNWRPWDMPPRPTIDSPDLPTLPDYSTPTWSEDEWPTGVYL